MSVVDAGSTAIVPLVVIVPPVSPAPAMMLVTVPVPVTSLAHVHPPAPLLFGTWPFVHDCGN
ncbi:MAG: hypothetical protein U1F54_17270 [Burkholderiales bacterium]